MAQVAREDREVPASRRRRDGEVGEAGRLARRARPVHERSRDVGGFHIERDDPVAVEMEHEVEPVAEAGGPSGGAGAFQPGDAVAYLGHGDRGQEQGIGVRVHPLDQRGGAFPTAGRSGRENVGVNKVHDAVLERVRFGPKRRRSIALPRAAGRCRAGAGRRPPAPRRAAGGRRTGRCRGGSIRRFPRSRPAACRGG